MNQRNNTLGTGIRSLREELQVKQKAFADLLSISPRSLSDYETGVRSVPSHVIERLVEVVWERFSVKVDINALFNGNPFPSLSDDVQKFTLQLSEMVKIGETLLGDIESKREEVQVTVKTGRKIAKRLGVAIEEGKMPDGRA